MHNKLRRVRLVSVFLILLLILQSWTFTYGEDVVSASAATNLNPAPIPINNNLFGGASYDYLYASAPTKDGGVVVVGQTLSSASGEISDENHQGVDGIGSDALIAKFNADGTKAWDDLYGGLSTGYDHDRFIHVIRTSDNCYLAVGDSRCSLSGDINDTNQGETDALIVKYSSDGMILWSHLLGGQSNDMFLSVAETTDGGYVAVGTGSGSPSAGQFDDTSNGYSDGLIVKYSADGNKEWTRFFGGNDAESISSIAATESNGVVVSGWTCSYSSGDITEPSVGTNTRGLIAQFNSSGDEISHVLLADNNLQSLDSVIIDNQNNIVVAGYYSSYGPPHWFASKYNLSTSGMGQEWIRYYSDWPYYGGRYNTLAASKDGGYLICDDTSNNSNDGLIRKIDENGVVVWERTYGGDREDQFFSVFEASNGVITAVGNSFSSGSGDITDISNGNNDGLIVSFSPVEPILEPFNYSPNVYDKDLALRAARYAALAGDGYDFITNSTDIDYRIYYDGGLGSRHGTPINLRSDLQAEGFRDIQPYNYHDSLQDNVSYVIANKFVDYNGDPTRLIVIAISGTDDVEWVGNMELTGTSYDSAKTIHSSFNSAKYNVLSNLISYEKEYGIEDESIILLTGHSRGAAAANLVADFLTEYKDEKPFYHIRDVFAYTFATPNAQKYANVSRPNIFNFCFKDDIVPQVPLEDYGYNKNGTTFTAIAENVYKTNADFMAAENRSVDLSDKSHSTPVFNYNNTSSLVTYISGKWKNTEEYYETSIWQTPNSLYHYMHDLLAPLAVELNPSTIAGLGLMELSSDYRPITNHFIDIHHVRAAYQVNDPHQMYTYYNALNNDGFNCVALNPALKLTVGQAERLEATVLIGDKISHDVTWTFFQVKSSPTGGNIISVDDGYITGLAEGTATVRATSMADPSLYAECSVSVASPSIQYAPSLKSANIRICASSAICNELEVSQLRTFAMIDDNYTKLGWNLDDPSTWSGVIWSPEVDSHVTSISLGYMDLTGSLNLSGFPQLTAIEISGNGLSELSIDNCPSLISVECPYNQLTQVAISGAPVLESFDCRWNQLEGLELGAFSNLKQLYCGNNMISALNLSGNPLLSDLYCESNDLATLDLSANAQLLSVNCEGNFLDIQEGTNLRASLDGIRTKTGGWSLFESQKIPEAAVFKIEDVAALTAFASQNENLTKLQWDLLDPKTWYGIEWAMSGSEYAVKGINLDKLNLTGSLNLQGMTSLTQLSCSGNQLSELDVSGCSSINYLSCSDAGLEAINLTGCIELMVFECADNYLDTSGDPALYNTILSIAATEGSRVNYAPQKIKAAVGEFDSGEVAALIAFANTDQNQTWLNWNPQAPGEWPGIEWGYADGKYHVTSIDISFTDVTGALDLSSFTSLSELNCGSTNISSAVLPESMTALGDSAFYDCSSLTSIQLPSSLLSIGSKTFYGCENLTQVQVPEGVKDIGAAAFTYCSSITSITIPASVGAVGENCFYGCTGLLRINFNSKTTNIFDVASTIPASASIRGYEASTAQAYSNKYSRVFETIRTQYAVIFDSQGGSTVESITADYNASIGAPTAPTRSGYSFAGWYQEPACNSAWIFATERVTDNLVLYAKWIPVSYTIYYYLNGGINNVLNPNVYTIEAQGSMFYQPTRMGYSFAGWYGDSDLAGSAVTTIPAGSVGDITLYAKWAINQYVVSFNSQGGSAVETVNADFDTCISAPPEPTRTGYAFGGWYVESDYSDAWSFDTDKVMADMTLYAKWIPNTYTIVFNGNDATSGAMTNLVMSYDTPKALTSNGFTKTGYTFAGWVTSATGPVVYANQESVANLAVSEGETVTLYAKWTPNTYTIKFSGNGATSGTMTSIPMTYDTGKALPANAFKKTGYAFLGWATSATGSVTYKDLASVKNLTATNGATINLYAKWGPPIVSATSYNYNSIKVSWAYAGSATSYKIYRATSATGTYSLVYTASSTARSWVNTSLVTGKTYYYKVYPVAGGKTYAHSTYKYAKAIPTTPTVTLSKASTTSIKVTWTGVSGATKYQVYRATSATGTYSLVYTASSTLRTWTNSGLKAGSTYYYKVRAYHLEGATNIYGNNSVVKYLKL